MIHGDVVSDKETAETMKRYWNEQHLHLCPHTAVGVLAAERYRDAELQGDGSIIALATAHPGKFSEVVFEATGVKPEIPARLAEFMKRKKQATAIGNKLVDLAAFLESTLR